MAVDDGDFDGANETTPVPGGENPRDRFMAWLQPRLHQAWVNVRVWAPFLLNPRDKQRIVRYGSRERREGLAWKVGLPQQCWECGATEGIEPRQWNRAVRNFDHPLPILAITGLILLSLAFLFWLTGASYVSRFFITMMVLSGGAGMAWVKSWPERVRISLYTCADHREQAARPDVAIFDEELHVFAPNPALAQAAQDELQAERRRGARRGTPQVDTSSPAADTRDTGPRRRPAAAAPAPELPSIKLDDGEPAELPAAALPPPAPERLAPDLPAIRLEGDEGAASAPVPRAPTERTKRELPPITFDEDELPASSAEERRSDDDELPPITLDDE